VIDAEDLVLEEDSIYLAIQLAADSRSWPNGFSITTATLPWPAAHSLRAQILDNPGKKLRRGGQIE